MYPQHSHHQSQPHPHPQISYLHFHTPESYHNLLLSSIRQLNPFHYVMRPREDPLPMGQYGTTTGTGGRKSSSSRKCLWFHFHVTCEKSHVYTLRIEGLSKRKISWNGVFVRKRMGADSNLATRDHRGATSTTTAATKWKRIQGVQQNSDSSTSYSTSRPPSTQTSKSQTHPTTHIQVNIRLKQGFTYEIALFEPYTVQYLRSRLKRWHQEFPDRCKVEKVSNSFEGRPINLVTVGSPEVSFRGTTARRHSQTTKNSTHRHKPKPTICITGRIHSGEVPSSWIIDGLLEYIIESNEPEAKRLRNQFCFRVIPMLNVDGVWNGYYRCNHLGYDLNRYWLNPSQQLHPEIYRVQKLFLEWKESERFNLDFFIDVHAHSNGFSSFAYYNWSNDATHRAEILKLPKLLSSKSGGMFSFKLCQVDRNMNKLGCSRRALGELMQIFPFAYTLESSFVGYLPGGASRRSRTDSRLVKPFFSQQLKEIGVHLASSLERFYQNDSRVLQAWNSGSSRVVGGKSNQSGNKGERSTSFVGGHNNPRYAATQHQSSSLRSSPRNSPRNGAGLQREKKEKKDAHLWEEFLFASMQTDSSNKKNAGDATVRSYASMSGKRSRLTRISSLRPSVPIKLKSMDSKKLGNRTKNKRISSIVR